VSRPRTDGVQVVLALALALVAVAMVGALLTSLRSEPADLEATLQQYAAAPVPDIPAAGGGAGPAAPTTQVSPAWVEQTATASGIPAVAVRAYAAAQLATPCALGWTTLAGIGWVESQHGTLGGRQLLADGHSSTPILGPALDGVGPVAAIPATDDSAALHSDREWDHAAGPMQFITSTWMTWRSDGDGDGVTDPYDLDDAALATARYLCASGDLDTGEAWTAAVLSYNHSREYVDAVHAAATAYAARVG